MIENDNLNSNCSNGVCSVPGVQRRIVLNINNNKMIDKVKVKNIGSKVKDVAIAIAVATVFSLIQEVVLDKIRKVV